jgi:hypothetical protein
MDSRQQKYTTLILIVLSVLTIVTGVVIFIHPPAIFPDPSWGYQVLKSMQHGGGFNMRINPDHDNIAANYREFLSWWSPGQYLLPLLFKSTFSLNLGQTSVVTITVCALIGLFGFYQFFKKIGFSAIISALSVAFIACQQAYVAPYIFYNGGEVLLFAFAGWFLYGCFSFERVNNWKPLLFILAAGLIGFFCKSSFMWIYAAGLLCLWIRVSQSSKEIVKWIINGIWMGIPAVASVAIIFFGYLSRGHNPASQSHHIRLALETFAFPLASPVLAGFSGDDLVHGLLFHPDGPMFTPKGTILVLIAMTIVSVWLMYVLLKYVNNKNYRLVLGVFYGVAFLFFSYAYLRQLAISYEGRHFRIVGLLIVPGTLYLVSRAKAIYKVLFGLIWLFIAITSVGFLSHGYKVNIDEGVHGPSGLTQQFIDQETLDFVLQQDKLHSDAIFVFVSPDLGLEIHHCRFITLQPIPKHSHIDMYDYSYKGHAGPIYIVLPIDYQGVRAGIIERGFRGYRNFKRALITDDYVVLKAE